MLFSMFFGNRLAAAPLLPPFLAIPFPTLRTRTMSSNLFLRLNTDLSVSAEEREDAVSYKFHSVWTQTSVQLILFCACTHDRFIRNSKSFSVLMASYVPACVDCHTYFLSLWMRTLIWRKELPFTLCCCAPRSGQTDRSSNLTAAAAVL
jgi:hypothetical protein